MSSGKKSADRMQTYLQNYRELTARLAQTGFIWPGHIQRRYLACGKTNGVCYKDPKARHGPYAYWTSKSKGKTVSRMLDPDEAKLLEEWIENRRKLEAIIRQMKAISQKAVKVALRLQKPG